MAEVTRTGLVCFSVWEFSKIVLICAEIYKLYPTEQPLQCVGDSHTNSILKAVIIQALIIVAITTMIKNYYQPENW